MASPRADDDEPVADPVAEEAEAAEHNHDKAGADEGEESDEYDEEYEGEEDEDEEDEGRRSTVRFDRTLAGKPQRAGR
ncbi:hypothetical protein MVEN_01486000 [Mycena venus]|uniref:Uncharacterized protein n=1 Tax=Mycena venus TaxID=2733690 RepID=A0A8H7CTB7_9AGAR|nr:hypothetical protein MVEN_01486000 [Mycena venus]